MSFWCLQFLPKSEQKQFNLRYHKAELLQEGIFFLLQLFAKDILVMKKLENEKTKPIFIISTFKTGIIKVGLVFLISNFFIKKIYHANKLSVKKYLLAVIQL